MKVTIQVENGDQDVEITRSSADITTGGSNRPLGLGRVLDLAVADVRRACELEPPDA